MTPSKSQHLLNRGQTSQSNKAQWNRDASRHNTFLIEVKHSVEPRRRSGFPGDRSQHLLNRGQTRGQTSDNPKEAPWVTGSQHLLNRGQTSPPRNRAAMERPPKSQHLLNRGQTAEAQMANKYSSTSQHLLNRGQTLRSSGLTQTE